MGCSLIDTLRPLAFVPSITVILISMTDKPSGTVLQSFVDLISSKWVFGWTIGITICGLAQPFWIYVRCIYFIFHEDKYDVGDKVMVDGRTMIVQDIFILHTLFRIDDHTMVQVPNMVLKNAEILNLTRNADAARVRTETRTRGIWARIEAETSNRMGRRRIPRNRNVVVRNTAAAA